MFWGILTGWNAKSYFLDAVGMDTKFLSIKSLFLSKIPKHVERKALKCWQGFHNLHKKFWTDSFLCTLNHVFCWLKRMCLRTCLWTAVPEAEIETSPWMLMSILHFTHLKRYFAMVLILFTLTRKIVNTSQVTPEDLSEQLTGVGVGKGSCEGVSKIQSYGQRSTMWKTQHLQNMVSHVLKNYGQHFSCRNRRLQAL